MNDTELLKKIHAQVKNHRKKNLSNQLVSEILDHKFDDFSASTGKRVVELEEQVEFEMEQKATARQQRNEAGRKFQDMEKQNADLKKHYKQVIYNVSKTSYEEGAYSRETDSHEIYRDSENHAKEVWEEFKDD